ncbi:hypothetical protein ACIPLC_11250 [Kitasatospora sp. NPDC086801]|uniref:hypothetical protein n=1 Tax=Kitasatospora sp. NPDC086801 TaxID=3364066 RepID=UPI0037FFD039
MTDPENRDGDDRRGVPGPSTGTDAERRLIREENGLLADSLTGRRVSLAELADDMRNGRRFQARERASGGECTYQVLVQVLLAALASGPVAGALPGTAGLVSTTGRDGSAHRPDDVGHRTGSG